MTEGGVETDTSCQRGNLQTALLHKVVPIVIRAPEQTEEGVNAEAQSDQPHQQAIEPPAALPSSDELHEFVYYVNRSSADDEGVQPFRQGKGQLCRQQRQAGVQLIVRDKDLITTAHIAEAVKYFASIKDNADMYVQNAAKNVEDVVSAVEDVNSDADIALIGMYNPYGNSLEYQGQVRDVCNVCQNIFVKAIDEAVDINIEVGDVQFVPASDAEQKSEDLNDISVEIKKIAVDRSYFDELKKQRLKALLTIAAEELAYPIQYFTAGKNTDPQMRYLNELLIDVADRHDATYVNVYDISNECNTDPHPTAEGHKEIADRLEAAVMDLVLAKMTSDPEEVLILGDVDSDGEVTVMDALAMQKYVADKPVSNFNEAVADINNDGEINITDTILIQKYTAGRPVDYPIGEPING